MSWLSNISKTYLINLDKRVDRMERSTDVLSQYGIPFDRFSAIEDVDGRKGIRNTLLSLFEDAIRKHHHHILVFEDDIEFIVSPEILNYAMGGVLNELPVDYDMCFLGANMVKDVHTLRSPHLRNLEYNKAHSNIVVANHAMIYSLQGVMNIYTALKETFDRYETTDMCIWHEVCKDGKSYASHPLIAIQRTGYSDIEKRETDYVKIVNRRK